MKLSEADVEVIQDLCGKTGKTVEELEVELTNIMGHAMIKNIPDEESRQREGMRLLRNRYCRSLILTGNESTFQLMVLGKAAIRKVPVDSKSNPGTKEEREVMNLTAIGRKESGGSYMAMRLAAWEGDIENTKVEPFTVYKANLKEKPAKGGGTDYVITGSTVWDKVKVISKESAAALIRKTIDTVPYTDYAKCAGNNKEYLVEGSIMRHNSGETNGRKFASYGVCPQDMVDMEVIVETQGLTVWLDNPSLLKWGEDSLLMFIGRFAVPKAEGRAVSMNANVVIPVIEYPLSSTGDVAPTPTKTTTKPAAPVAPKVDVVQKKDIEVTSKPSYFDEPETPKPKTETKPETKKATPNISNIRIVDEDDPDPFGPAPASK
jgi:hypothetical protein